MRSGVLLPLVSRALLACGDPGDSPPDAGPATTIHISAIVAPALVTFRDGIDAAWQPAIAKTPTTFEIEVHGAYLLTVVCNDNGGLVTTQTGQTPDEPQDLGSVCGRPEGAHRVTGHMAQPGTVAFGPSVHGSAPAEWDFAFSVPDGTYDLLAAAGERVAIRRGIAVRADLAVTPALDLAQQGTPLVDVAFSAANATAGEALMAVVLLGTHTTAPLALYVGPNTSAKAAPEAALVATDDQTVSMRATSGTALRALRRPFRVGGDPSFLLPPPMGAVQWAVEQGQLSVTLPARQPHDYLFAVAAGAGADSMTSVTHVLSLSAPYLEATGLRQATHTTDIPGYQPDWRIDFARPYSRFAEFEHIAGGAITTTSVTEQVNATAAAERAAAVRRATRGAPL